MKNVLVLFALILSLNLFGRTNDCNNGWSNFYSLTMNMGTSRYDFIHGTGFHFGSYKNLSERFDIGAGAGFEYFDPMQIPIFLQVRRYMLLNSNRSNLFTNLKTGMTIPFAENSWENDYDIGLFINPEFGWHLWEKCKMSVGYRYQETIGRRRYWNGDVSRVIRFGRRMTLNLAVEV